MNDPTLLHPYLSLTDHPGIETFHHAATRILEETGLNVHHTEMYHLLLRKGARPGGSSRLHIPSTMVEEALESAKREVTIHNRLGQPVMPLGPHQTYFGTGSDLIYTRDVETMERRPSVLEDVSRAARLCDALDVIDFVMSSALPSDVRNEDAEPRQFYAMLHGTIKPIIMTSFSGIQALERLHGMACTIAGDDKAYRQRPNYILYGQFVSPLQHDHMAIERLVFCAEHEVPLIYIPTIMPGASGPLTLAGSLALAVAETLAGLVMHQAQRPGAPFIFGACISQLDMRTMLFPYGSPEWRLADLLMAELARHYDLPVFGTGGATDSKLADAQAGAEYSLSLLVSALAGTNLIHDVGYLDSGLTGSLESIVLGADQIAWVKRFMAGVEVTEEHLALQTIAEVGPGGQFLEHEHTLRHLRGSVWSAYAVDRAGYDHWVAGGAKDYAARARDHALALLEAHRQQPIDDKVEVTLRELGGIPV